MTYSSATMASPELPKKSCQARSTRDALPAHPPSHRVGTADCTAPHPKSKKMPWMVRCFGRLWQPARPVTMLAWLIAQRPIPNEKVMPRVVSMLWQPTRPVTMLALQVALRLIPKEKKN